MRWAVFKDYRGVAYCEPVNDGINIWTMNVPAREEKRHWLTRKIIHGAREAERRQKAVFDDTIYSRDNYYESAFTAAPEGYEFQDNLRYMLENRWGPVDVLVFIEDDTLGKRMQYEFRRLAPEGELYDLSKRDKGGSPHPDTDRIIDKLRLVV